MIIPQELQLKIIERLSEKGTPECKRCHSENRSLASRFYLLSEYRPEPPPPYGEFPMIVVICNDCGGMEFFSAVALGVIDANTGERKND